jgi:hypothetical protein
MENPNGSDADRPLIDLDSASDEQAIGTLTRQFPQWQFFRGVNHLVYARRMSTRPEWLVRGEDWTDLRDELRRALARREAGR